MTDASEQHGDPVPDPVARGHSMLRRDHRGTLQFDEHFVPIKYVIDPETGRLVAPVMVAMLTAAETILFVPEEDENALQMLVSLEAIDENHAMVDRWRIFHGEPEDVRWAEIWIDMAKLQGMVVDGDALMEGNPLAEAEPRLCKLLNEDIDALRAMTAHRGGMEIESPKCVGVDQQGVLVRAKFDIVRVWFDTIAESEAEARELIEQLIAEAKG